MGSPAGAVAVHKLSWNTLKLEFNIFPKAPLLVKSGHLSPNPALPDMQFVRTSSGDGETIYLPGSSLKGVFRSFTEKMLRTMGKSACDPFDDNACGKKMAKEKDTAKVYKESCYACKIYGNTKLRGRLSFQDTYPEGDIKTEIRYSVAISRLTNAVAQGPFDMEIVVAGNFKGVLLLENFEVWQLGLLALAIQAINEGWVRIGFGKNRGFGQVEFKIREVTSDFLKTETTVPETELWGIGAFVSDDERTKYGLRAEDLLTGVPKGKQADFGIFARRIYKAEEWELISKKAIENLPSMLGA
jgi:CRISPR-associated protein Csm3